MHILFPFAVQPVGHTMYGYIHARYALAPVTGFHDMAADVPPATQDPLRLVGAGAAVVAAVVPEALVEVLMFAPAHAMAVLVCGPTLPYPVVLGEPDETIL